MNRGEKNVGKNARNRAADMESVLRALDSFCATECEHPWACEGCPVDGAKRKLVWLSLEARVRAIEGEMEARTVREMNAPSRHLTVIRGGKSR
jgi:hypothetical protein